MDYISFLEFLEKEFPIAKFKVIEKPVEISSDHYLKLNTMEHKTDIGGVIKVSNKEELKIAINKLRKISNPPYILQEKVDGTEFIVGLFKDKTFGYVIMFGGGGTLTELYKDVSFRKCPITKREAEQMIFETKIGKLFKGFRNIKLNLEKTKELLVNISKLPNKINFKSIDFNPIIINEKEAKIVDARLIQ